MRITRKTRLTEFCEKHPEATAAIQNWYTVASAAITSNYAELKKTFNSADYVGKPHKVVIFDVGGQSYRIVAIVHFQNQRIDILHVFTHAEYSKWLKGIRKK